ENRVVEGFGPFDEHQRVVVGGSFQMDRTGVRLAVRKFTDPAQATSALGFRCAASTAGATDAAEWIVRDLAPGPLAGAVAWDTRPAPALRRWESAPGQVSVPGYRLITRYEQVLFCPVASLAAAATAELSSTARARPQVLGFLSVPRAMTAPELPA